MGSSALADQPKSVRAAPGTWRAWTGSSAWPGRTDTATGTWRARTVGSNPADQPGMMSTASGTWKARSRSSGPAEQLRLMDTAPGTWRLRTGSSAPAAQPGPASAALQTPERKGARSGLATAPAALSWWMLLLLGRTCLASTTPIPRPGIPAGAALSSQSAVPPAAGTGLRSLEQPSATFSSALPAQSGARPPPARRCPQVASCPRLMRWDLRGTSTGMSPAARREEPACGSVAAATPRPSAGNGPTRSVPAALPGAGVLGSSTREVTPAPCTAVLVSGTPARRWVTPRPRGPPALTHPAPRRSRGTPWS